MEHVRQGTTYFTAVEPEPVASPGSAAVPPARRALVKRWLLRKWRIIDAAVEQRIMRWGTGH